MARVTKGRVVCYFQDKGARVHFNEKKIDDAELEKTSEGVNKHLKLRYGIVEYNDMLRDMNHWETLISSSLMQRPFKIITEDKLTDQHIEAQDRNLASAFAFACLTS